ncbi:hypothetical protein E2562_029414 [Oryza meyeriana var. granulata]|uniref:Uncharacterized protein n=1 Tax=Oryza meyeriana var. granulata TaxID=110450 RepID=A0A6G1C0M2_9ORYZ|nr:hypothetical protein E2562_029414 [Oryza meyeriana var. granulata]
MSMNITLRAAILKEFSELFGASNLSDYVPWVGWMDVQPIGRAPCAPEASRCHRRRHGPSGFDVTASCVVSSRSQMIQMIWSSVVPRGPAP